MADILLEAQVMHVITGERRIYTQKDLCYAYRESILKNDRDIFVIDMLLDLTPKGGEYESYTPANLQSLRKLKQPPGFSCGSFFKNPKVEDVLIGREGLLGEHAHVETWSAGKLIDDVGLKGYRIGGVHISERHGNFFINDGGGTWKDILALRDHAIRVVYEKHGIRLHEEVRIISNPEK
jgi:UDP-N-acetylmuramate dehydrogenase